MPEKTLENPSTDKKENDVSPINECSEEILQHILQFLSAKDLVNLAQVNKKFYNSASDNLLWEKFLGTTIQDPAISLKKVYLEERNAQIREVLADAKKIHEMELQYEENNRKNKSGKKRVFSSLFENQEPHSEFEGRIDPLGKQICFKRSKGGS